MKPKLRIATYNIFLRLQRWEERLPLIVKELDEIDADIICLQEVVLPRNTAKEIADKLQKKYFVTIVTRDSSSEHDDSAIAILSKKKPIEVSQLVLGSSEKRVAMRATFRYGIKEFDVVNTHLYWKPYNPLHKTVRLSQVKRILSWAKSDRPEIICGDMNATPRTSVMHYFYRRGYNSGFKITNGKEPDWTCANPVANPERTPKEQLALYAYNLFKKYRFGIWRDVLDYILVTDSWKVLSGGVFGDKPAPQDPKLFPSDHRGVYIDTRLPLWKSKK